jgi:multiple sugar transport system permease protein
MKLTAGDTTGVATRPAEPMFRRLAAPLLSANEAWALFFLTPFAVVFVLFVIYPVGYALYLGTDLSVYGRVLTDPLYLQSLWNTFVFILFGVGLKMLLALALSSLLVLPGRGMRIVNVLFILPWIVPHIPSIFSIRWMLNSEWGMINNLLFALFRIDGPAWLTDPRYAMGSIIALHIWKYLPFWTMIIVAARVAIPRELYEAAQIDGASPWAQFRHVTFPSIATVFVTSTMLSAIWSLGDFNSIYLLTGGGPMDRTNTLATMGIRFAFNQADSRAGVVTMISALPLLLPLIFVLMRRLGRPANA